jgi:hypothetical protein
MKILLLLSLTFFLTACIPTKTPLTSNANPQVLPFPSPDPTPSLSKPFTAQFMVFTHGTKRVFTDPKYHNQSTDVFLTANDPSVINVQKYGLTWEDFFSTLPFSLTTECLITGTKQTFCTNETQFLSFYLNGQLEPNALQKLIQPNDQFLVTVSPPTNPQLREQLNSF